MRPRRNDDELMLKMRFNHREKNTDVRQAECGVSNPFVNERFATVNRPASSLRCTRVQYFLAPGGKASAGSSASAQGQSYYVSKVCLGAIRQAGNSFALSPSNRGKENGEKKKKNQGCRPRLCLRTKRQNPELGLGKFPIIPVIPSTISPSRRPH